jgi:hypothetical protein
MRPAFSSTKQAAAFALLLLMVLLSPVLAGKKFLPPREQAYASLGWGYGPYPWIRRQIFEETNDLDIVFLGSSHIMQGIDPGYVQAELSAKLGRPATVRTIAWGGPGYDGLFLITQDLLQHRRVHQLVFYDEKIQNFRNAAFTSLFRFGENARSLSGLSLSDKGLFYCASVIGMPRDLLGLLRPNIPAEPFPIATGYIEPQDKTFIEAPMHLGAVPTRLGFNANRLIPDHAPFASFEPSATNGIRASIYTVSRPSEAFKFSNAPLFPWEIHFAGQFARLVEQNHCQLVMLHVPILDQVRETVIQERAFWPAVFSTNMALVGVPPYQMFQSLTDDEIKKLYSDEGHLNRNGMELFTPLVTPALLKIYDAPADH